MPNAAYTLKRRIGSIKTNASGQWVKFIQDGDQFYWDLPVADIVATNPGTALVVRTLPSTPLGLRVAAVLSVVGGAPTATNVPAGIYVWDPAINSTPTLGAGGVVTIEPYSANASPLYAGGQTVVMTNTSQQVNSKVSVSGSDTSLTITVIGWIDRRGRDS
ncbi:hypothetical protein [Bradyrhizobium manausense]|nr:hypothetical protein [Bradyrhizobium manausense]